ncbi:MAG: hypothetical protein K2X39_05460, partial [Silvanigrellaceae bacterium]|nr:hypothetical protein [Silvanigrellaceae bacterium]
ISSSSYGLFSLNQSQGSSEIVSPHLNIVEVKPKFLMTQVQYNALSLKVFVEEKEPVLVSMGEDSEDKLKVYSVLLKDSANKVYGEMAYSLFKNHVELLHLEKSEESARHVGMALVEWLLLKSYELGKEGNIELTSDYGSYVFWYPMGFRSQDADENTAMKTRIAARQNELIGNRLPQIKESDDLSFSFMYLPSEGKARLLNQFAKLPDVSSLLNSHPLFARKEDHCSSELTISEMSMDNSGLH